MNVKGTFQRLIFGEKGLFTAEHRENAEKKLILGWTILVWHCIF